MSEKNKDNNISEKDNIINCKVQTIIYQKNDVLFLTVVYQNHKNTCNSPYSIHPVFFEVQFFFHGKRV